MAETRARDELAQLVPHPLGGWSFRLLQTTQPTLVVDDLTVTLVDSKFRIVHTDDGKIERPAATVDVTRGTDHVRLQLAIDAPQAAFGHIVVLDDLSDGALPGWPPQFTAQLSLDRR